MNEAVAVSTSSKHKKAGRRLKQGGFGALEIFVALGIGILAVLGALAWKSKLDNSSNNQVESENIASLIANTKQLKTASGYGASSTNLVPLLINFEGVPGNMSKSGVTITNVWGGSVTLISTGAGFTLTYADVPTANCIFLATQASPGYGSTLRINGGSAMTGEVTSSVANAACTSSTNSLAWSGR